jgi:hypothetical protein
MLNTVAFRGCGIINKLISFDIRIPFTLIIKKHLSNSFFFDEKL